MVLQLLLSFFSGRNSIILFLEFLQNKSTMLHLVPPEQVGLKTPLGKTKGITHPTLAFTVSSTVLLDQPIRRSGSKPAAATAAAAPAAPAIASPEKTPEEPVARTPTPGEQLVLKNVPLDDAFEQNMVKDERGIFTWSTSRKREAAVPSANHDGS